MVKDALAKRGGGNSPPATIEEAYRATKDGADQSMNARLATVRRIEKITPNEKLDDDTRAELASARTDGARWLSQSAEASKKFVAGARTASLQRMKERMEKSGGTENYDKVVKLLTPE